MQGKRGHLLGNVFDLYVHVQAVLAEPAQAGIGCRPAIDIFFETRDGAVIDDLALFIAPATINNLAHFDLVDVASDDAVHQSGRIFAGDQIFIERRDIDKRSRVANSVVLVLVNAHGVIARPFAVVQAVAERERSLVKCGSDGQADSLVKIESGVTMLPKR